MSFKNFLLITFIGALLFIPFLGGAHLFDWDEINFAESAREMLLTHNFSRVQINFQPFWEKPPLFIWLQALSMQIFGVNEFAARFPNAMIGIVSLLVIFFVGSKKQDSMLGWLWVLAYIGSFLPHFYFKSGIIDPLFNLFIFLGVTQFSRLSSMENMKGSKRLKISALAGIFLGLAILTKGPAAMLIVLVTMFLFWIVQRFKSFISFGELLVFLLMSGIVSFFWFGLETIKNGPWFIVTFFQYQVRLLTTPDAGHGGPFYYHFVVLLLGCFAASVFVWNGMRNDLSDTFEERNYKKWMILLLVSVLLIFSIVKTKIIHYSSLAYFPLTYLAADYLYKLLSLPDRKPKFYNYLLLFFIGVSIAAALILLPYIATHISLAKPYTSDPFALGAMEAKVHWTGWESLIGIFYLAQVLLSIMLLRKKDNRYLGVVNLFISTAICVQLIVYILIPRIEAYSQRAAITFFEKHSNDGSYVDVLGYKSYAHLFYAKRQPQDVNNPLFLDWLEQKRKEKGVGNEWPRSDEFDNTFREWLLTGKTDRPVYFVTKIQRADEFIQNNPVRKIGEENGFVFLEKIRQ